MVQSSNIIGALELFISNEQANWKYSGAIPVLI